MTQNEQSDSRVTDSQRNCLALPAPTIGTLSTDMVTSGTSVTLTCPVDYILCGTFIIVCIDGTWSDVLTTCKKDCPPLTLANAEILLVDNTHCETPTVTCHSGYTLIIGDVPLSCTDGTWHGIPMCVLDCLALPAPTIGTLSTDMVTSGTSVTLTCPVDYILCGTFIIVCIDGTWSDVLTTCKKGKLLQLYLF
ncbi:complement factor H-related protein 5-like [Glandiceps talaboti]